MAGIHTSSDLTNMSTKRLVLLVLLAAGATALYIAGAPAAPPPEAEAPGLRATLTAAPGRLYHGLGVFGAKVISPAVHNMVRSTERELALLRQELKSVPRGVTATTIKSAHAGARRVAAMDSSALAHLAAGQPVQAFKDAMQANGLVTAVLGNLRGE